MMDKERILEMTVQKQSQRIATLSLDLDLAYSQLDILREQLAEKEKLEQAEEKQTSNSKK